MRLLCLVAASSICLCCVPALAVDAPGGSKAIAFRSSAVPVRPHSFASLCTDLNGDGKADVAVTHPRLGSISVCLGAGNGSFQPCADVGRAGGNLRGLGSGDFNRDGRIDLAASSSGDSATFVLDGLGDGRFSAPRQIGRTRRAFMLTVADLNNDAVSDIAVAEESSGVVVFLADGRGGFERQKHKTGKWSSDVAAADFNHDGHADLAVTNWGSNDVSILLGQGGGGFAAAHNITYEGEFWDHHALYRVLAADLDRDGHTDMVWNDIIKQDLYLVYGDGTGAFPRWDSVPAGRGVRHAETADFDGDGWPDLVSSNTADNDVSVLLGDGRGGFTRPQRLRVGRMPRTAAACDLNGDRRPDVVVTSMKDEALTVLLNQGVTTAAAVAEPPPRKLLEGLLEPSAVLVAKDGRIIVADEGNQRVASIDPATGTVTTIAGTGFKGSEGDGASATDAQLLRPSGLAQDTGGNLYIADSGNHRIRKIDARGIITTIAGTGAAGFSGDGGPAPEATLNRPTALAIDASNTLFIADSGNHRIRTIDASGIIRSVECAAPAPPSPSAAESKAPLARRTPQLCPWANGNLTGIALQADGSLVVVDRLGQRVFKRDPSGGVAVLAGNGTAGNGGDGADAVQGQLAYPSAVAAATDGAVLIADAGNNAIRSVTREGTLRTVAASAAGSLPGVGVSATPWAPSGVAVDTAGNVYFTDRNNHCVRRIDRSGHVHVVAGKEAAAGRTHEAAAAVDALPLLPLGQDGPPIDLVWEYVVESGSDDNSIYAVTPGGSDVAYLSGDVGTGADWRIQELRAGKPGWHFDLVESGVDVPFAATRLRDGTLVVSGMVDDDDGDRDALVLALAPDGTERWRHRERRPGEQSCHAVAGDAAGNLYLGCESERRWETLSLDAGGKPRWKHDDGAVGSARAIAVDAHGGVFVAGEEPQGWRVAKLKSDGTLVWQHRIPGRAVAYGIAATGDGGAVVAGTRTTGRMNLRAERLAPDGAVVWEYEASSAAGAVIARAVTLDPGGGPVLAGEIGSDWLVLGLDATGKRRWHFTHDGGGGLKNRDQAFALAIVPPNELLVAGRIHRLPMIPPSLGQVEWRAASYRLRN